jgi:hypothetical protein
MKEKKRRMQNVSFRTFEDFLDFLQDDELALVEHLRALVFATIPGITERLSYNVPRYRRHGDICFIWPGSVSWGTKTQNGVRFGFTQGYLLPDETGFLDKGNRKQVYWHDFFHLNDIVDDLLVTYLVHATDIDTQLWKEKNARKH